MANTFLIICGLITGLIGVSILIINSSSYSNNQGMIQEIERNVIDCYDKNKLDKARDGDLVFISGEYISDNGNGANDRDFELQFREIILKRTVERYQKYNFRLLEGINEEENVLRNENKSPKELQFIEDTENTNVQTNENNSNNSNHKRRKINNFFYIIF